MTIAIGTGAGIDIIFGIGIDIGIDISVSTSTSVSISICLSVSLSVSSLASIPIWQLFLGKKVLLHSVRTVINSTRQAHLVRSTQLLNSC